MPQATSKMEEGPSTKATASSGSGMTVDECQGMIRRSLRTPMVKFLIENMEKAGCTFGDNFTRAVRCDARVSGGYTRGEGIIVCSNHLKIPDEVNQVVIHELIHAYDDCRAANLNWANCEHHACSEIRAGHLSGDRHFKRELLRCFMKLRGHEQECVRRRVMKSLINNPYYSEAASKDAIGMFVTMTPSPLTELLEICLVDDNSTISLSRAVTFFSLIPVIGKENLTLYFYFMKNTIFFHTFNVPSIAIISRDHL